MQAATLFTRHTHSSEACELMPPSSCCCCCLGAIAALLALRCEVRVVKSHETSLKVEEAARVRSSC